MKGYTAEGGKLEGAKELATEQQCLGKAAGQG